MYRVCVNYMYMYVAGYANRPTIASLRLSTSLAFWPLLLWLQMALLLVEAMLFIALAYRLPLAS